MPLAPFGSRIELDDYSHLGTHLICQMRDHLIGVSTGVAPDAC
jgi:hypothetical protein